MELWPSPVKIRYEKSVLKMIKRGYSIQEKLHIRQIRRLVKIYENTGFTVDEKKHTCRKIRGWLKKSHKGQFRKWLEYSGSKTSVSRMFYFDWKSTSLYWVWNNIGHCEQASVCKIIQILLTRKIIFRFGAHRFYSLGVCLKNPVCQSASKSHINLKLHI